MEQAVPPQKKKIFASLRQEFNNTFRGLKWKDVKATAVETVHDLRKPKEILKLSFALVAGIVMPGAWVGYAVYRLHHYRKGQKAVNDNNPQPIPAAPAVKPPSP